MIDYLIDNLDFLIDRLTDGLNNQLINWLIDWLTNWLIDSWCGHCQHFAPTYKQLGAEVYGIYNHCQIFK